MRRFYDTKTKPLLTKGKVAIGAGLTRRPQYVTLVLVALFAFTQIMGVLIFTGSASAVGPITYDHSVVSVGVSFGRSIAKDSNGNIYEADYANSRIRKYDSSGTFIAQWGQQGSGDGQFGPERNKYLSLAIDDNDIVYVLDNGNNRVQKFNASGIYQGQFGQAGSGDGQLNVDGWYGGIDVDSNGVVYIADTGNYRVERFNPDGTYKDQWGSFGINTGQFRQLSGIKVDTSGNVYTSEPSGAVNNDGTNQPARLQKFDSNKNYVLSMQHNFMHGPSSADVDAAGNVYVGDRYQSRFWKYNSSGQLSGMWINLTINGVASSVPLDANGNILPGGPISSFSDPGTEFGGHTTQVLVDGTSGFYSFSEGGTYNGGPLTDAIKKTDVNGNFQFLFADSAVGGLDNPVAVAMGSNGIMYISSRASNHIQKYVNGIPKSYFGYYGGFYSYGAGADGSFYSITDTVVDSDGFVYVLDAGYHRIQKFTADGVFVSKWGSAGSSDGQFSGLGRLGVDSSNNIYVTDASANRIQKFDSNGNYLTKWGSNGTLDGQFRDGPYGIAIGADNKVYVADGGNNRIQIFNQNGSYLSKFGASGTGNGQFTRAFDVALNSQGMIFVSDSEQNRVQKFSPDGRYIAKWGGPGSANGAFFMNNNYYQGGGLAFDSQDNIYVTDPGNYRVQIFADNSYDLRLTTNAATGISQVGATLSGDTNDLSNITNATYSFEYASDSLYNATTPYEEQQYQSGSSVAADSGSITAQNPTFSANVGSLTCGTLYHFRAKAVAAGETVYGQNQTFTTADCPLPFAITTETLPDGVVGYDYDQTIATTSSGSPVFSRFSGTLPTGLSMDSHGRITGTTTGVGSFVFAVLAFDGDEYDLADYTVTVTDNFELTITTTSLPPGVVGTPYSQAITTNSPTPVTFFISSGSLPDGLSISVDGVISGTPTTEGTSNFWVMASDGTSSRSKALQIVVSQPEVIPVLTITTTSLASGKVGSAFTQTIHADQSEGVTFARSSGSLPAGLSLSSAGVLSGTPTTADTYNFTISATNGSLSDTQDYTVTIVPADVVPPGPTETVPPVTVPPATTPPQGVPPTAATAPVDPGVPTKPAKTTPVKAAEPKPVPQNTLFAAVRAIPAPIAIGFPWALLGLALLLVGIQYYQVHAESTQTKKLLASLDKQRLLVEQQNTFVALTTHYLHTPLTIMEGEISLMSKAGTLDEATSTKLRAILTTMSATADQVLDQDEQQGKT